ncbi:MAG: ABC transporter permease [Deltaproteobacteria bacterium]|nr:ABC transporter permease [Deltaproteobacteria bacterium]MBW1871904.1 ABC transporter permease [Deltaproteobacteria bacterium]
MTQTKQKTDQPSLPGSLSSLWLVSRLFFRVNLGRKRIIWIAVLMLVPIGLAVFWRIAEDGIGLAFFTEMTVNVFLQFFALGLPLYLGVSAVRDEIEDKTIVYLFARPVHRAIILGGKMISVALVVSFVLVLDLVIVYAIVVSADGIGALGTELTRLLISAGTLCAAVIVYTAVFSLFGVLLNRPMILAMMFGLGWEMAVSNLPGAFPRLTLMYYLKSLLGLGPETTGMLSVLIPPIPPASTAQALEILAVMTVLLFSAAFYIGSRKEYKI